MDNNIENGVGLKRNTARDVFLHLLAMVTLCWSAVAFVTLVFQYINYFYPDALYRSIYYQQFSVWIIRSSVASLIIVFPLFIFVSWYLNKIYRREYQVRESKIRKWLIYLTLFIATLIIIGDLVSIIFNFLGGEVQVRFILKSFSILITAGVIFGYYLDDVRKSEPIKLARYFAVIASIIVLVSVVGAFFIIGSPAKARAVQFDTTRISDLQNMQYQISYYYQKKGQLPEVLTDLKTATSYYTIPNDPETGKPYEYNIKDNVALTYELCANFGATMSEAQDMGMGGYYSSSQDWNHGKGRTCFQEKIDTNIYKPIVPIPQPVAPQS